MSYEASLRLASRLDGFCAADCMWSHYPWPRMSFDWPSYRDAVCDDVEGQPAIIVNDKHGVQVGWLCCSHPTTDMHMAGTGTIVYSVVIRRDHPRALRVLMQEFKRYCMDIGAQWYHITHREDETTFRSRIHKLR